VSSPIVRDGRTFNSFTRHASYDLRSPDRPSFDEAAFEPKYWVHLDGWWGLQRTCGSDARSWRSRRTGRRAILGVRGK
jgi:hypothetical protein